MRRVEDDMRFARSLDRPRHENQDADAAISVVSGARRGLNAGEVNAWRQLPGAPDSLGCCKQHLELRAVQTPA